LAEADFRENLRILSENYRIREPALLVKSTVVLVCVIVLFFLQSIPSIHLTLGWIAILGAVMLMVLADTRELDAVIARVEWTTLIFFGALFVVMEALVELKLLLYVGHLTQNWIRSVHHDSRLIVSIIIITWVSALASSFVDNIPFTTVMATEPLIGASANVVCAGVAEQHGYKFSFFEFFSWHSASVTKRRSADSLSSESQDSTERLDAYRTKVLQVTLPRLLALMAAALVIAAAATAFAIFKVRRLEAGDGEA
ncbi:hypothetical protein MTO96_044820, partial [Rhipicephalus appendiculatus]